MKPIFKKILIFIILFIVFLAVSQLLLWIRSSEKFDYAEYNSLNDFCIKKSNLTYTCDVLAQNDKYAVCLGTSYENNKPYEFYILSKNEDEHWKVLKENIDYKLKSYTNININADLDYIYTFDIRNTKTNIIIVWKVVASEKFGEYIFSENDKKLNGIEDLQNTLFYYFSSPNKKIEILDVYYTGFVDNFNKNSYILTVNGKQYPYNQWKKLLKSY